VAAGVARRGRVMLLRDPPDHRARSAPARRRGAYRSQHDASYPLIGTMRPPIRRQ